METGAHGFAKHRGKRVAVAPGASERVLIRARRNEAVVLMTDLSLEAEIGRLLAVKKFTLAVAESCTGGLLGARITAVSGSSAYFLGGAIVYANRMKTDLLGVPAELIAAQGAVSDAVARRMALGVCERTGATVGLALTGVAGPDGGTPAKPVGLVFAGLACGGATRVREFRFAGDRAAIRAQAVEGILGMLKDFLEQPA